MKKAKTAIDLFAGAGGFSLGFRNAGFKILVAVEFDKWAAETYRCNHKETIMLEEDIVKITPERLLKIAGIKKGKVDALIGGPPCQGFTTVNSRRSVNDPRSRLMFEFIKMVKGVQPKIFYIENVPGLFYFKDFFILLMKTLEGCGYVVRCLMMDAVNYGVPQRRKRIFIQGMRKDLDILPTFPPLTHFDLETDKKVLARGSVFPASVLAGECFAKNGFSKEEVKDLYWNKTLNIQMNRKADAYVFDVAIGKLIGEYILSFISQPEYACAENGQMEMFA